LAASSADDAVGLVAEILEIPEPLERAVAAVLGESLQAVVMRDHATAREAVQALRRAGAGRAMCVPRAARVSGAEAVPGGQRLLDLVGVRSGDERVAEALLGSVLLVDDLDAALALWESVGGTWTVVTRAGERIDPVGAITGGSEPSGETLLAQRRELRALDGEVVQREEDLRVAVRRQEELSALVAQREGALAEVDAELGQMTVAVVGAEKDVQSARHAVREIQARREGARQDLDEAQECLETCDRDLTRLAVDLGAAEARRGALEVDVTSATERLHEVATAVTSAQGEATEHRVGLARERARRDALESTIERLGRVDGEVARRTSDLEERKRTDARSLAESEAAVCAARERSGTLEA
jgi:chromosome segregation protein